MMTLDPGNILLKPSHRRQLANWLRRTTHLGNRLGNFGLNIAMQRTGRFCEVTATLRGNSGDFVCKSRRRDWQDAARDLVRTLSVHLRDQRRLRAA